MSLQEIADKENIKFQSVEESIRRAKNKIKKLLSSDLSNT
jgi:predicted DNA-binding protein YlxM (UPF0122 family)